MAEEQKKVAPSAPEVKDAKDAKETGGKENTTRAPRTKGDKNFKGRGKGKFNRSNKREEKIYEERVVAINRVSKTVKGGRTMRFSALVVVGDGNGHVGAGLGKAGEVPEAIRKGKEAAIKNLVEIPRDENNSIPHDFLGKFGSASVLLKRAPEGTGIIAGGPVRAVVELAGIRNIRTKSLGSNNKTNVVLATMEGLLSLKTPEQVAKNRGKSVEEVVC